MNELERWANFYLLMSAAAATLLGLMFVVITLAAERMRGDAAKIPIYLTPTVIYFASVHRASDLPEPYSDDLTGLLTRFFHLRPTGSLYWAVSCPFMPLNADSPWWPPVCCRCLRLRSATPGPSPSTSLPSLLGGKIQSSLSSARQSHSTASEQE
jgi:hypothetical protein